MPYSPNTEEGEIRLIARAQAGDEDALERLYREHERRAYNLALRMLGDPWSAADVTQDAFIKAFSSLGRFREDAKFSTWLHRIVVNTAYDYLRKRRDEPEEDERLQHLATTKRDSDTPGMERGGDPASDGLSSQVKKALLSLEEDFRVTIVLCDLLGFTYREAAEILEVEQGTVKSRIFRARARLARILRDDLGGENVDSVGNNGAAQAVQET